MPAFSILIPTWNNLPFLKICLTGLKRNSGFSHHVIVHVNEGVDGTLDFVKKEGITHTHSEKNIGVCRALNAAASLAQADLILYLNDDMFVCPGWDLALHEEAEKLKGGLFYLSATLIEPKKTSNRCVRAPYDFGRDVSSFRETDLLSAFPSLQGPDWCGASWPPALVHRDLWKKVQGYSEEFFPGPGSDPDFSMKLWQAGVRIFKGVGKSLAYHFLSRTVGRMKLAEMGSRLFLGKWGITPSVFYRHYLRMGEPWNGPLPEPEETVAFKLQKLRCRIKKAIPVTSSAAPAGTSGPLSS